MGKEALLLNKFVAHKRKDHCDDEYLTRAKQVINGFFEFCEENNVDIFRPTIKSCKGFQAALYAGDLAPRTINSYVSTVRVFFNFLVLIEEVMINPFIILESLNTAPVVPTYVPISEIKKLFHTIDSGAYVSLLDIAVFECMYGTGIKAVELINLLDGDYSKQNEALILRDRKRDNRLREVPLPAGSVYVLKHYLTYKKMRFPLSKNLFVKTTGKKLNTSAVRQMINGLLRLSSPGKKGVNAIKFSYRNHLLKAGAKIENVALLVGGHPASLTRFDETTFSNQLKLIHNLCHPRA